MIRGKGEKERKIQGDKGQCNKDKKAQKQGQASLLLHAEQLLSPLGAFVPVKVLQGICALRFDTG